MSIETPSVQLRTFLNLFERIESNIGASGVSGKAASAAVNSFEKPLSPILLNAVVLNR